MSRITQTFKRLRGERAALIPFITAGDPDPAQTVSIMHRLVEAGADLIELGIPFSDPMADGLVIQRASERALSRGVTPADVFDMVRAFRERDTVTPVILMGYLNLIEACGYQQWVDAVVDAGVDGEIIVDLPPEESAELKSCMDGAGLDMIFLIAPTTTAQRIELLRDRARGFIYYVSLTGVTGAATIDHRDVKRHIDDIRARVELPVGVGFGIRDAATAAALGAFADAVIVGSALVDHMHQASDSGADPGQAAYEFLAVLSEAVGRARTGDGAGA